MPESRGVLSVRLRAVPEPDFVARPLEPERPVPAVRPVETLRLAGAAQLMRPPPVPALQPVVLQADAVPLAEPAGMNQEAGLRPLNLTEAKVAYRLALLAAQAPPVMELPAEGMLLELSLAADGRVESLRSVRSPSTLSDPAWLDWLEQAAAQVRLPSALRGHASRIEIELLP